MAECDCLIDANTISFMPCKNEKVLSSVRLENCSAQDFKSGLINLPKDNQLSAYCKVQLQISSYETEIAQTHQYDVWYLDRDLLRFFSPILLILFNLTFRTNQLINNVKDIHQIDVQCVWQGMIKTHEAFHILITGSMLGYKPRTLVTFQHYEV